jgi:uncharacterized membrane protein YgdD (TMEM256/DUF423 family)
MTDSDLQHTRRALLLAGGFGLLGVAAGAFGAHGLEDRLAPEQLEWWNTAARYQQIHAVAILAAAALPGTWSRARVLALCCFALGIVIFAGTLDAMALGGPRWLGAVTPFGGLALIVGWASLVAHAFGLRNPPAAPRV